MKTNKQIIGRLMMGCVLACCLTSNAHAQNASSYAVVENGANYRVLQKTTVGNGTNRIHQYVELATGLYYKTNGQWVESQDLIETYPQGAIARHGPYQVIFANNLNSAGAIDQQTPDGKRLRSSILGLAYDDRSTGKNVLIAQIQDSQGELISSNQVLYPNAFDGVVKADVRYTYRKGSFEQDVILRQQPPTPESLGLNSQSTEIEVLTEFINPPQASIVEDPVANNALPDEEIGWGIMRIGHGKAFDLGEPRNSRSRVSVRRQWVTAQGRNILVEGVPLQRIKKSLANLPLQASAATKLPMLASKTLTLPKTPLGRLEPKPMRLALASPPDKGFVLDYTELNTSQSDFTFQPNTTYFISGSFGISGTTTFGAGTVIKFPEDGSGQFYCANVVCATTPYSPAIFTSENDDSAGEVLPWSNGSPTAFNCGNGLEFSGSVEVDHCRFSYFGTALTTLGSTVFNDAQFSQCYWGIVPCNNVMLNNALVNGCNIFCDGGMVCSNASFYNCSAAADGNSLFYNCTFSAMGNTVYDLYEYGAAPDGSNNAFDNSDQAFGANVVTGSIVDAGNTTADKVGLYWWTTQGPIEGTTIVDLGYHTPAVDGSGNPISTLVPGVPDYISDPRGVGLPDAWQEAIFGNLNQYASDLDPSGNTLFYDYTNVIEFTLESTNTFVTTNLVALQVSVSSGAPAQQAVLINSTNYAGATWTTYASSNLTVNLGSMVEGNYAVWVGLRNPPNNPNQSWQEIDFTIDTTPPVLTITNPTSNTLGVPLVQVQGSAGEDLAALTFDVSNATGVVAGQPGTVMQRYFDTNSWSFSTNYFQCFDIMLVTGMNLVTIHATDLAGNTTTSNLLLNLDFSTRTNPPLVSLTFPQDGLPVSGASFTLDGFVDDPMATIAAQIVDASGDTNVVSGVVERNGRFWVDNLPLAGGTNVLTLTITDSAGHTSVTNIGVIQSAVTLAIIPVDPNLLWQSVVNVTGTISGSGYAVSVNGVSANVIGNSWSANNVPVTPGGVACFTAMATAGGQTQAAAKSSPPKPDTINGEGIAVASDTQTMHTYTDDDANWWPDETETGQQIAYTEDWYTGDMNQDWAALGGGSGTSKTTFHEEHSGWTGPPDGWVTNPPIYSTNAWAFLFSPLDPVPYDYSSYLTFSSGSDSASLNAGIGYEYCDVQNNYNKTYYYWGYYGPGIYCFEDEHVSHTYSRSAHTIMMLLSGGRGIPGQQMLHYISGWAKDVIPAGGIEDRPSSAFNPGYVLIWDGQNTALGNEPSLPNSSVQLLNDTLHDDPNLGPNWGSLYYKTAVGAGPIEFMPTVSGDKFYTWQLYDAPYILTHQTECPALTDTNLARQNLGVGEYVTLSGMPSGTSWSASAGGIITNWDGAIIFTAPSNAPAGGTTTATVTAWVGGQQLTVDFSVFPPSGVDHAVIINTACNPLLWPNTGVSGVGMQLNVYMKPTYVSFYRVQILEIGEDATSISGYFTDTNLWTTDPASALHHYPNTWFGLNADNSWPGLGDVCYNPGGAGNFYPQLPSGGWSSGSFTWVIPAAWRVEGTSDTNSMTGWNQVFTIDSSGTATITKFNQTVTRTINNVITPCL